MSTLESRIDALLAPVAPSMERMRTVLSEQVRSDSGSVRDMTDHVSRFRGKQLRAAMVLLTGEALGTTTDEHPTVAAIVEMIHLATLVHDDVLDGSTMRRRVACVNERWDNQIAVLLGDFLYARAFSLSTDLRSRLVSKVLADTTRTLCVGEIEQATKRFDFELTQATYEAICSAKTGSLYSAACELGPRYPERDVAFGAAMARYGAEVGLAFQIVDDCLDVAGEEAIVGKTVGNDVEDGKITLPVLHAWRMGDERVRAAMREVYTQPGEGRRIERLRKACNLVAGVDYAMARAHELVESARGRLRALPASAARDSLDAIAQFTLERRF